MKIFKERKSSLVFHLEKNFRWKTNSVNNFSKKSLGKWTQHSFQKFMLFHGNYIFVMLTLLECESYTIFCPFLIIFPNLSVSIVDFLRFFATNLFGHFTSLDCFLIAELKKWFDYNLKLLPTVKIYFLSNCSKNTTFSKLKPENLKYFIEVCNNTMWTLWVPIFGENKKKRSTQNCNYSWNKKGEKKNSLCWDQCQTESSFC